MLGFPDILIRRMTGSPLALSTDLYELTMAAAYFESGFHEPAIFELFVRALPRRRSYLIVAGLPQAIDYLTNFRFSGEQVEFLRRLPVFKHVTAEFFQYLVELRFNGDAWAMPEGRAAFGMEPLLRITASIVQAQLVETVLLSIINFQTLIASKAARIVTAAGGREVVEFGARRAHGPEAGVFAGRAAYLAGCAGTSNLEAGRRFGIPTFGTMAHSFIMAFNREEEAFRAFLKSFPDTATILLDTYDTLAAAKMLAAKFGPAVPAVRLDSGNLLSLSRRVRRLFDDAGMRNTRVFATGDLNEERIARLIARGAPIDGFGVGTDLSTSRDAPALGGVYKLVGQSTERGIRGRIKASPEKSIYPLPKQVWRFIGRNGKYTGDLVAGADERIRSASAAPLLHPVMRKGRVVANAVSSLEEARTRAAEELRRLPPALVQMETRADYPVRFSEALQHARRELAAKFASKTGRFR